MDIAISRAQTRKAEILASATSDTALEDSDQWLNVSPDDLDAALAEASGLPKVAGPNMDVDQTQDLDEEANAEKQAKKLGALAKKVEAFVEGRGELEGAVFEEYVMRHDPTLSSMANTASLATTYRTAMTQMT